MIRAAGLLAAALAAAGCGARSSLLPADSSGSGGGGGACAGEGEPCAEPAACCGGQCADGLCGPPTCAPGDPPVVLAAGPERLSGVLPHGRHVYFTHYGEQGAVLRVPRAGGAVETLVPASRWTESLAVDEAFLYFMDGDRVARIPRDGGEVTTLTTEQDGAIAITVDEARAYWINPGDEAVLWMPKAGGAPEVLALDPDLSADTVPRLIADDTTLYWTADGLFSIPGFHATPKQGGGAITTIDATPTSHPLVDAAYLYWIDEGNYFEDSPSSVMRARKDGSDAVLLTTWKGQYADLGPGMAQDEANLYWSQTDARSLMRMPKAGGTPVELTVAPRPIEIIAVEGSCVYFTYTRPPGEGGAPESTLVRVPSRLPGE